MNSPNTKIAKTFIRIFVFIFCFMAHVQVKAWEVDFSRRQKDLKSLRMPASIVDQSGEQKSTFSGMFESVDPAQEIVILNTENGFVPDTVRLKKGQNYRIHVVNVNEKEKNISFILDAFSEHHATFFGKEKNFNLSPKQDGIYSFVCPETSSAGKIVIYSDNPERQPASE